MFDLLVLGGGPAGYLASERAGHAGLSVCCFEMRELGGVCLNEGCIPSKVLLNSAKIYDHALHGEKFGVVARDIVLDHAGVQKRRAKVVRTLAAGVKAKMKANNVTVVKAEAVIRGHERGIFAVEAGGETYEGRRILVATGSSPVVPLIAGLREGLESGWVLLSREVLTLPEAPERLAVIGGGVVGLEMAAYYNTAGSQVTVIEMLDHIAGPTDREISDFLLKEYQAKGVDFRLGAKVVSLGGGRVTYEKEGETVSVPADKVLLSIGRKANAHGIGLEAIGVETNRSGVVTDARGSTNVPNVYAAGDVNGRSMLAHTAYREAEVCVNTMLGKRDTMRYHAIPSVVYTAPEVASVGLTEEEAKAQSVPYECRKLSMRYAGRFVAENDGDGLCKVLMEERRRSIIGVHMIGAYASEIIWGAAEMIETGLRVEEAREIVFPHPTVSEIIRDVMWEF
ncbi:MAG: dihydrolipoyl dehydrogenase [Firmicutes bacterium]|nr:dihydrolipoyl dehydrogenase [Bacillota bacterium]